MHLFNAVGLRHENPVTAQMSSLRLVGRDGAAFANLKSTLLFHLGRHVIPIGYSDEGLFGTMMQLNDVAYPIFMGVGVLDLGRFFYAGDPHGEAYQLG